MLKIFESFKENANKNLEKLNENYNFLLLSILIAGRGLGCSSSFANFPGFRGEASPFPSGYAIEYEYTPMYSYEIMNSTAVGRSPQ